MDMTRSPRHFLLASLLLALLAVLPFTPGLPGAFVFDDIPNIVNNSTIHLHQLSLAAVFDVLATPQISGHLRGLPTLSFALDYWRAGGVADPGIFKTTNLLIHALTACVLAGFLRRLLRLAGVTEARAPWLALALAFAWAAHPLQVSAVLYAVQRLQTMGTLFVLLALAGYLRGRQAQIEGRSGKAPLLLASLAWAAALNCKEDTTLVPAYTLALELTVLRFAATEARVAQAWRRVYQVAVPLALALFVFWVLPHYWQTEAYPGRDFNSAERLLTQARVLCLYLWQILLPLPQHLPFYYDWLSPSRSLLQPWTTLAGLLLIAALLFWAWRVRHTRPLFVLGVLWFFAAHAITSNVVGLELAYEHRNHFALIGALLALGSLLAQLAQRLALRPTAQAGLCVALLIALACGTALRAQSWNSNISLARAGTQAAPLSARAWIELCDAQIQAGGGAIPTNPLLDEAVAACAAGAKARPDTLNSLTLLTVLKTVRGEVTAADWARLQQRLATVRLSWDNARAPLILLHYASQGVALDKAQVLAAMATLDQRTALQPHTLVYIGEVLLKALGQPDAAMPYFLKALAAVPPGNPYARELADALRARGRPELAQRIEQTALPAPVPLPAPPPGQTP